MSSAIIAKRHADDGQALVDAHTGTHFGVGVVAGLAGVDAYVAMMAFVGAKIVTQSLGGETKRAIFGRIESESLGNEFVDLFVEMIGHHVGHALRDQHLAAQAAAAAPPPTAGLGAYYVNQPYVPISGLGAYYQDPMYVPIR